MAGAPGRGVETLDGRDECRSSNQRLTRPSAVVVVVVDGVDGVFAYVHDVVLVVAAGAETSVRIQPSFVRRGSGPADLTRCGQ